MGLDQEVFMLNSHADEGDMFECILLKRNCYPLHVFIAKWLEDTYKLDMLDWKRMPFGPYICLPRFLLKQFYTALKKRNRGGGHKQYKIWSKPGQKLKVAIPCAKEIPPLVRRSLEGRLSNDLLNLVGSHVGGQCKYDRLFPRLTQAQWDSYPEKEQEDDFWTLYEATVTNSGGFYYYASW